MKLSVFLPTTTNYKKTTKNPLKMLNSIYFICSYVVGKKVKNISKVVEL